MRVLVVGGGIAGLTTATVLGRLGHAVVVVERSPDFATVGAGIGLAAGPEAILDVLGVDRAEVAEPIARLEVRDARGRALQAVDTVGPAGADVPRAYARPELHGALLAAAREVADLRGGTVADAATGDEHDLVVGADDISSATRQRAIRPVALRYSGGTCWRAIVPNVGVDASFEAWGDGVRVGGIPLTGGRLLLLRPHVPSTVTGAGRRGHHEGLVRRGRRRGQAGGGRPRRPPALPPRPGRARPADLGHGLHRAGR